MYERIKKLCKEHGISITRLCEEITGSKGNLATWKKGNVRPEHLYQIAEKFNVSTDYLLGKKQSKTPLPDKATAEEWRKILEDMEMAELIDVLQDVSAEIKLRQHGQEP